MIMDRTLRRAARALAVVVTVTAGATATAGVMAAATAARAAAPKEIGVHRDWAAYVYTEKAAKTCYVASEPKKSEGKYTRRGRVVALVTHRPAARSTGVVSLIAGYNFKEGADATVRIGDREFSLFTDEDTAWTRDAKTDTALVAAMKGGQRMIVRGVSSRGTKTTDTYSLSGFSAAYRSASKACGVK